MLSIVNLENENTSIYFFVQTFFRAKYRIFSITHRVLPLPATDSNTVSSWLSQKLYCTYYSYSSDNIDCVDSMLLSCFCWLSLLIFLNSCFIIYIFIYDLFNISDASAVNRVKPSHVHISRYAETPLLQVNQYSFYFSVLNRQLRYIKA